MSRGGLYHGLSGQFFMAHRAIHYVVIAAAFFAYSLGLVLSDRGRCNMALRRYRNGLAGNDLSADRTCDSLVTVTVFFAGRFDFVLYQRLARSMVRFCDHNSAARQLLSADLASNDLCVTAFGLTGSFCYVFSYRFAFLMAPCGKDGVRMHSTLQAHVFGLAVLCAGSFYEYQRMLSIVFVRSVRVAFPEARQSIDIVTGLLGKRRFLSALDQTAYRSGQASVLSRRDRRHHDRCRQDRRAASAGQTKDLLQQRETFPLLAFFITRNTARLPSGRLALENVLLFRGYRGFLKERYVRIDGIVFGQGRMLRQRTVFRKIRML